MTTTRPRPPAMPRGRYWHVKAFARGVAVLFVASFISFQVIATNWLAAFIRHHQKSPFWRHSHGFAESITFRYDAPLVHGYADFLIARLTYEPTVALLLAGLLCTVALEVRERRRRREP